MPKYEFEGQGGEGGGFEPVPKGDYAVKIDSVEPGVSKGSGNEQFIVKAHITEGPLEGKEVTIFYSRNPKSLWKWRQLLDATGVDYEARETGEEKDGKPIEVLSFDTDDLEGVEVRYTVSHRSYEGKTYEDWNDERGVNDDDEDDAEAESEEQAEEQAEEKAPAQAAKKTGGRRRRVRA